MRARAGVGAAAQSPRAAARLAPRCSCRPEEPCFGIIVVPRALHWLPLKGRELAALCDFNPARVPVGAGSVLDAIKHGRAAAHASKHHVVAVEVRRSSEEHEELAGLRVRARLQGEADWGEVWSLRVDRRSGLPTVKRDAQAPRRGN